MVHVLPHKNCFLSVINFFLRLEHSFCLHVNLTHDIFNNFVLFSFKEIIKPVSPSELFPSLPIVQVCLVTLCMFIVILRWVFLPLCVCICDIVYEVLSKKEEFVHYFMAKTPNIMECHFTPNKWNSHFRVSFFIILEIIKEIALCEF